MHGTKLEQMHLHKPRTIILVTLQQLKMLCHDGVDVLPCCHSWVTDESIQDALDQGLEDTSKEVNRPDRHRAARVATFVRMIDTGVTIISGNGPFYKGYAEMYFRGTAVRFKMVDMNTRWRAMQFRNYMGKVEIHVFGEMQGMLRDMLPADAFLAASQYAPATADCAVEYCGHAEGWHLADGRCSMPECECCRYEAQS